MSLFMMIPEGAYPFTYFHHRVPRCVGNRRAIIEGFTSLGPWPLRLFRMESHRHPAPIDRAPINQAVHAARHTRPISEERQPALSPAQGVPLCLHQPATARNLC